MLCLRHILVAESRCDVAEEALRGPEGDVIVGYKKLF